MHKDLTFKTFLFHKENELLFTVWSCFDYAYECCLDVDFLSLTAETLSEHVKLESVQNSNLGQLYRNDI